MMTPTPIRQTVARRTAVFARVWTNWHEASFTCSLFVFDVAFSALILVIRRNKKRQSHAVEA
jgi:hypothetical protein